jgi:hypothetical protein
MKKRFNFKLTPSIKEQYTASLNETLRLERLMIEGIPENALKDGLAMGTKNAAEYCRKASAIAVKFPHLVDIDAGFTVEEMTNRYEFSQFWSETRTLRTESSNNQSLIEGANGRDLMGMTQRVKDNMEVNRNLPKYKADYDDLNLFFTDRAEVAKMTSETNSKLKEAETIIGAQKIKPS